MRILSSPSISDRPWCSMVYVQELKSPAGMAVQGRRDNLLDGVGVVKPNENFCFAFFAG